MIKAIADLAGARPPIGNVFYVALAHARADCGGPRPAVDWRSECAARDATIARMAHPASAMEAARALLATDATNHGDADLHQALVAAAGLALARAILGSEVPR